MLLEREIEAIGTEEWVAASARPSSAPRLAAIPAADVAQPVAGARYGESKGISPAAIAATALVHLVLAAGLLAVGVQGVSEERERLTVVDLTPDTAPPPAPPAPPVDAALEMLVPTPLTPTPVVQPPVLAPALPLVPEAVALPQAAAPQTVIQPAPPVPAPSAPAQPSMVSASDLDTRMIAGGPPSYPVESRRKREQGTVELLVIVGVDGRVETISLSRSSGHDRLDKAALGAVRKWRWSPTVRDGVATKVRGIVEIPFVLQGTN